MKVPKIVVSLIVVLLLAGSSCLYAQDKKPEHLLDGMSLEYYYQNGTGVRNQFYDGKLQFEWIVGPQKGNMGKDIPYKSRKIGDEMFIVNFHQKQPSNFVTLIFNFKQNVVYSSAIVQYGTEKERIIFDGGIIENVKH